MNLKKLIASVLFSIAFFMVSAQENPITWTFKTEKISATEYNVVCSAALEKGWATYSQYQESNDGPIPTSIVFTTKKGVELIDKNIETGHKKIVEDKLFGMKVAKFTEEAIFTQRIKIETGTKNIKGYVTFMCCNDEICLPPRDLNFDLPL